MVLDLCYGYLDLLNLSQGERSWYAVTVFAINRYHGTSRRGLKTVSTLALTEHRKQPVMGTFSAGFFDGYSDSMYAYLVVPRETAGNGTAFFPAISQRRISGSIPPYTRCK